MVPVLGLGGEGEGDSDGVEEQVLCQRAHEGERRRLLRAQVATHLYSGRSVLCAPVMGGEGDGEGGMAHGEDEHAGEDVSQLQLRHQHRVPHQARDRLLEGLVRRRGARRADRQVIGQKPAGDEDSDDDEGADARREARQAEQRAGCARESEHARA